MSDTVYNPYPGLSARDDTQIRRITVRLPREDAELLETVFGGAGWLCSAVHTLTYTLCNELRKQNLTRYNPELLWSSLRRLADSKTLIGNSWANTGGNHPGGVSPVCATPATPTQQSDSTGQITSKHDGNVGFRGPGCTNPKTSLHVKTKNPQTRPTNRTRSIKG